MWTIVILRSSAQPSIRREVNSSPLSDRTLSGWPRSSISRSSTRVTRPLLRLVSASSARHSRVPPSFQCSEYMSKVGTQHAYDIPAQTKIIVMCVLDGLLVEYAPLYVIV